MNKVEELEHKWFKYRVKKLILPLMSMSAFTVVMGGAYYLYETRGTSLLALPLSEKGTTVLGVSRELNASVVEERVRATEKKEVLQAEAVPTEVPKVESVEKPPVSEELALVPIIPVIDMEKEERIKESTRAKTKRTPVKDSAVVHAKRNAYLTAKELASVAKAERRVSTVHKTKKMNFQTSSSNYIGMMKEKFAKSKNPREAILLSKSYYKTAQYGEAEKWALAANKLDASSDESWILFAKSKAKLGKKQEALKILVSYYKKSQSTKVKRVIGQIKTGKI